MPAANTDILLKLAGIRCKAARYADDEALQARLTSMAALLTGVVGTGIAGYRLNNSMEDVAKSKRRADSLVPMLEAAGLNKKFVVKSVPGLQNAGYVSPGAVAASFANDREQALAHAHGAIIYDPKFNKPGILAHEIGHGDIRMKPWHNPSRMNQTFGRPLGAIATTAGVLGAPIAAAAGGPWVGLGVGALGALGALPTLINERQATSRGLKYLNALNLPPEEYAKNKKMLSRAGQTYMAGGLIAPLVSGGLSAGLNWNRGGL